MVNIGLFDGKVANPRKESSSLYSVPRDKVGSEESGSLEFYLLFSSRISDQPRLPELPSTSVPLFIPFYLPVRRFADRHSLSSCELFELSPCVRMRRDEEAFRGGTRWRVGETGKQRQDRRKRERENMEEIDRENSRDTETSFFAEIPVLDEFTTIFAIADDCRSRGKCFQGKY